MGSAQAAGAYLRIGDKNMADKQKKNTPDDARKKDKAKKKYRKPELSKHGILSIVEGD